MKLPSYFKKFLREIRPTEGQREDCITGHTTLRDRLDKDEDTKPITVSSFLQGSYRRATAIRPKGDEQLDVDVVVVTRLSKEEYSDPNKAMDLLVPFLKKHYKGKYHRQGRSFGIELSYVDLDLVIAAAPSESEEAILTSAAVTTLETPEEVKDWRLVESWIPFSGRGSTDALALLEASIGEAEWKAEPLWIPDRDAKEWKPTNPLEQIKWTWGKNARCNGHYVNVVKAIKWWQKVNYESDRPKGYPLEHLVGVCCPDSTQSVAEGVTLTLEAVVQQYAPHVERGEVAYLADHGIPESNVLARVSKEEFAQFYKHVTIASRIARAALDADKVGTSARKWRELFGDKFPPAGDDDDGEKGPFVAPPIRSQTGDLTPRRYGEHG